MAKADPQPVRLPGLTAGHLQERTTSSPRPPRERRLLGDLGVLGGPNLQTGLRRLDQDALAAEAALLETESASRGAVIDHTKMIELPLNGRDYNQLALLSPGVLAPTPLLQSVGFRGVFNVNGNRAFQNAFQLDGVDNTSYSNSFRGLNAQVIQPSVEALQEFKI